MKIKEKDLKKLIEQGLSINEISLKYYVSESTVRRRLITFRIKKQHTLVRPDINQELVIEYYNKGLSGIRLAKLYKCSRNTIYYILRKNKINIRTIEGRFKKDKKYSNQGISRPGKLNPNWKDGISKLANSIRTSKKYHHWRFLVFKRDRFRCQLCGRYDNCEAHHLVRFKKILKDNNVTSLKDAIKCKELWYIDNGLTVCYKCHKKIHKKEGI